MCSVNINIDEATIRGINPHLNSPAAIRQWAQELVDSSIKEMQAVHDKKFIEVDIDSL